MANKTCTGAEALIHSIHQHGVEYIFGHPGGAAIPIFDALVDSPIKFILTRHEQGATHMADGVARATGKAGVVLVTSGPGATNAITGNDRDDGFRSHDCNYRSDHPKHAWVRCVSRSGCCRYFVSSGKALLFS